MMPVLGKSLTVGNKLVPGARVSRGLCHAVSRSQYVSRRDGHAREVGGLLSSHPAHTGAGAGAEPGSVDQSEASMKCIDQSEASASDISLP